MTLLAPGLQLQSAAPSPAPLARLSPSPSWTGIAASGFAALPVDPLRTTAKPASRLITPPHQRFTSSLIVGAMAAANHGGSLIDRFGVEKVIFHFEGTSVEVAEPRWQVIPTAAGNRIYLGWWVELRTVIGESGTGHLYIEAIPGDAAMQRRVIGPFAYSMANTLYDGLLEIAPSQSEIVGSRYATLLAASTYAKGQGWDNTMCTITEPGRYDMGDDGGIVHWYRPGYFNITASVPGVYLGKTSGPSPADWKPNRLKLHVFGSNITLDRRWVGRFQGVTNDDSVNHWFDGVNISTTAPDGRNELIEGAPRNPLFMFAGRHYFTECNASEGLAVFPGAMLVRGCSADLMSTDLVSAARCVIQSTFTNQNDDFWNTDIDAFTVQYSGTEAVATLARSGGTESFGGGVWTCTIGANSHTFDTGTAGNTSADAPGTIDGYWFDDVVAWLNTLPDITATLALAANQRAANTGTLAGLKGQGFAATDIKSAALTVTSYFDKHGDFYQQETGDLENVIVFGNLVDEAQVQCIFLSPDGGGSPVSTRDAMFIGNIFNTGRLDTPTDNFDPAIAASQIGRPNHTASHVVIAHNSFVDQRWLIRTDGANNTAMDGFCLFTHNITPSFDITGADDAIAMVIQKSRLYANASIEPKAIGFVTGGSEATLFADEANSDYRPSGDLLLEGFAPAIPFDRNRKAMPAVAAPGALAAQASNLYIIPPIFIASSISGTAQDGESLSALASLAGDEPIALAYQWQRNGNAIAGQSAATITLDKNTMGLAGGDTISCIITATNAGGAATATPSLTFVASEFADLVARLSGRAGAGMWDFRQGNVAGNTLSVANLSGGLGSFLSSNPVNHPAIAAGTGALFDGINDTMTLTTGFTDDATLYLLLRKDAADDAQGHILNAATIFDPGSGAGMTYVFAVDGVTRSTRIALHSALDDGAWKLMARSGSLSASGGAVNLGRNDAFGAKMDVRAAVLLRHADFASDLAAAQAEAQAWLATLRT